jgi:hypothetical protein
VRDEPYKSAVAFRRGVVDRLRAAARERGRPPGELHREFLLQRFLARIFAQPSAWVLKGGAGLLVRLPGARYSDDLDLLYPLQETDLIQAVAELRQLASQPLDGDYLRFEIADPRARIGQTADQVVAQVKVAARVGTAQFGGFPIDLSMKQRPLPNVDRVRPDPVVELPGVAGLPEFVLYPLPDQIADKVCAMYDTYGGHQPSTRYHDLVDLALIVTTSRIDALPTAEALRAEAARRGVRLPASLESPGVQWTSGYAATAADTSLPPELQTLDAALDTVGSCLNPLLQEANSRGVWDPIAACWTAPN